MGLYLEPPGDKLKFLKENGVQIISTLGYSNIDYDITPKNEVLICLVNYGVFYAAAVMYSAEEFNCFNTLNGRDKTWFYLNKELAKSVSPDWDLYINQN